MQLLAFALQQKTVSQVREFLLNTNVMRTIAHLVRETNMLEEQACLVQV